MSLSNASTGVPIETVIPDCCNIGVIFRAIFAVNTIIFVAILMQTKGWTLSLFDFTESAMLIEPACLLSLLTLCGLRNVLRPVPLWGQRMVCALLPAAIMAGIIQYLSTFEWFLNSFSNLTLVKGMSIAALFGIVLQHYFELRTRAFSPALVEARLQALQARIRPHFLFNSLNAVLSLIRVEPQRAETTLEDLADLFRVLMREPRYMTSIEDEIRICKQYLSIEKIRLGERLQVQWEIINMSDEILRKVQMPALLLQPLLENAVHYGVEPARDATLVQVCLTRSIDRIEIVVINPYRSDVPVVEGNNMALNNIRERLALLYDVESELTTAIIRGHFEVRLRFPSMKAVL